MSDIHAPLTDSYEEGLSRPSSSRTSPPAETAAPEESLEGLSPQLAALVRAVEPPALREFVHGLLLEVNRLLCHVESVRATVENARPLDGVMHVFGALRKSSVYLLTNIEMAELQVEGLSDTLNDTLQTAAFALRHELRRVFEKELAEDGGHQFEPQQNVLRACALLENCFQQLTISLARAFDPRMSGVVLFESYRRRREQSLTLRGELRTMLEEVRATEDEYSVLSSLALLRHMRRFRYECLHYLMYRDWEDFERFADALELYYDSELEMQRLLHRLSCYVQTLLSQVEMRAVLSELRAA